MCYKRDINKQSGVNMKIKDLLETASAGASSSGSIASVATPLGGEMASVIKRMPPGQSFFAPAIDQKPKKKRKKPA